MEKPAFAPAHSRTAAIEEVVILTRNSVKEKNQTTQPACTLECRNPHIRPAPPIPLAEAHPLHLASNAAPIRIAYFPDSFHEVNGVAHTSRNFAGYAARHDLPFLCIRASLDGTGPRRHSTTSGHSHSLELRRSLLSIRMEKDLQFDPLFPRHAREISRQLRDFRPEVIHITGPSELGIFGAWFAWKHRIPLAASWHTNVHEYAARRVAWLTRLLPQSAASHIERVVEDSVLAATLRFYSQAHVLFAPNPELCTMLEAATRKPCHLMQRGVDTHLFNPTRRTRPPAHSDPQQPFTLGYIGRLSIEKNVSLLIRIERELHALGITHIRFLIVGHGRERALLQRELRNADFTGVLHGEPLTTACANMDLLVFPSHTDTFGNVVLEALASGVPAIVTPSGGPRFIVRDGETGYIAPEEAFAPTIACLIQSPATLSRMRQDARAHALTCSWDNVFHRVYAAYPTAPETLSSAAPLRSALRTLAPHPPFF